MYSFKDVLYFKELDQTNLTGNRQLLLSNWSKNNWLTKKLVKNIWIDKETVKIDEIVNQLNWLFKKEKRENIQYYKIQLFLILRGVRKLFLFFLLCYILFVFS